MSGTPTGGKYISIHSLRMEGDRWERLFPLSYSISIHSLRMEGDVRNFHAPNRLVISIHSLRMEGDTEVREKPETQKYFNPLPPHGGRQIAAQDN